MGSSQRALLSLLDQCLTFSHIKQIQSLLTVSGNISDPFIASKVISTCAISDFGDLYHSYRLFSCLPCRNTVIWNTMIRAFEDKELVLSSLLYPWGLCFMTMSSNWVGNPMILYKMG
ncbi:hypothetical protein K1719_044902 [Acacia pycnantha]|nr:hypothetical protein K1719_044902 [Acacia pycnantha]